MDPVLKAGLLKLFVLALLQTTATHTVTECREEKKYRTFLWIEAEILRVKSKYYTA